MIKLCSIISNLRIDKYLSDILNFSRRHITFLINSRHITVNEKFVSKSYLIKFKDEISINIKKFGKKLDYSKLKIVWESKVLMALYKPEKFHSAKLFKSQYSVEDYINSLNKNYILLNRLDYQTQGIILIAKNRYIFNKIKNLEKNLYVEKFYIGILKKHIKRKICINNELYSKNKVKVEVLNITSGIHITKINPLANYTKFSVANIKIFKGARHQIRAHLSFIKNPLLFDYKYYEENINLPENYFLFCYGYIIKPLHIKIFEYKLLKEKFIKFIKDNRLG